MTEQNWFSVTTWALEDWRAAVRRYHEEMHKWRGYPEREVRARTDVMRARADYRQRVLSWFWRLCAPLQVGECVPSEVALLLAEDWDLRTGNGSDRGAG